MAHELVHILSRSGRHSDEEGQRVLRRSRGDNRALSAEQCDQFGPSVPVTGLTVKTEASWWLQRIVNFGHLLPLAGE